MHCVSLYILKKSSGPHEKLVANIPCADTGEHLLVPITDKLCTYFKIDPLLSIYRQEVENALVSLFNDMVLAETDYFGGCGDQNAFAWKNKKKLVYQEQGDYEWPSINKALKEIGIEKTEGLDEYDTVGLGRYRENDDVIDEWESAHASKSDSAEIKPYVDIANAAELSEEPKMMQMHTKCPSCDSGKIFFEGGWSCRNCNHKWT